MLTAEGARVGLETLETGLFNELRVQLNELTPQELEAKRLEKEEPGIAKVKWGA